MPQDRTRKIVVTGVLGAIAVLLGLTRLGFIAWFTNPIISVLPRILIGPVAWLVWAGLKRWPVAGLIAAGIAGTLTNTILVLGAIGLLGFLPWAALGPIAIANGLPA